MTTVKKCNIYMICLLLFGVFYQFSFVIFNIPITGFFGNFMELFYPGIIILLFFVITKENPKRVFQFKRINIKNSLLIIVMAVVFYQVASDIGAFTNFIFPNPAIQHSFDYFAKYPAWYALIIFAMLPAIFEELSFRGVVFYLFKGFSLRTAAIMVGLYFGFFHLNFNQFFYAAVLGFLMVYIVYYAQSIFASMLFHFTFNSFGLLIINLNNLQKNTQQDQAISASTVVVLAVNTAIFLTIFFLIFRQFKKYNIKRIACQENPADAADGTEIEKCENKQKIFTPAFFIIISIFVVVSIFVQIVDNIKS